MLQFIDKIVIKFNPFSIKSKATRTFLSQITSSSLLAKNKKINFKVENNVSIGDESIISIFFYDKKQFHYDMGKSGIKVNEVMSDLKAYCKRLQLAEDIKNAS